MDALQRVNIEMLAYQNGWEVIVTSTDESVVLRSALHSRELIVTMTVEGEYRISTDIVVDREEIDRLLGFEYLSGNMLRAWDSASLSRVFETTSMFARSLPDQPLQQFKKKTANLTIDRTEVERVVKQRIGQDIYRSSLLEYWGGACALTGIRETRLLRASHAKPWAECESDDERLNVYNGFLLEARYDALFDQGLITFSDEGVLMISDQLDSLSRQKLQLGVFLQLRWIAHEHIVFLNWHRNFVFQS